MPSPENSGQPGRARPRWRLDPIWLSMIAVCGLIVVGAAMYWRAQRHRSAVVLRAHLFKYQGDLLSDANPDEAVQAYRASIEWIRGQAAAVPELQAEIPEIQSRIDAILANSSRSKVKDSRH